MVVESLAWSYLPTCVSQKQNVERTTIKDVKNSSKTFKGMNNSQNQPESCRRQETHKKMVTCKLGIAEATKKL